MSERHYFNINDPADVLENASYIALLVGYNLDDTDKRDLEEYYSLLDSYYASQVGCRTITKRIQELPCNSDGTIAPCAEKQHQELIKMNENAKEYEEKHSKTLQYFLEHSTLVHTLQRKHKEKCKQETLCKQEEQQPKSETAPCIVQPNKTEVVTLQKNKKSSGFIALRIILAILVIGLSATVVFFATHQDREYTITYYNNKGIYFFYSHASDKEIISTHYQDNTIYKVEKFSGKYPTEPTPPINKGYVFLGWYLNPECTDKFLFGHYEVKGNINLYAKWGLGK